ncbi:molybdopterin molybdotransferase MoeA [soil metagenome]
MALVPVNEARERILSAVKPLGKEDVSLAEALGRVLAADVRAVRDQPPFPASAMDGYAVKAGDDARLKVIGTSSAGHAFGKALKRGEAVRIFTGAPVPKGGDAVVIQENTEQDGGDVIVSQGPRVGQNIRRRGLDFKRGDILLKAGIRLGPRDIGLAAAMNRPVLPVRKRPRVTMFTTGDELVPPGGKPRADQITSSNSMTLSAFIRHFGGEAQDLGIIADTLKATMVAIRKAEGADILVTTGGASVGDHDFVREALEKSGIRLEFWKIAMRPGKPFMFARRGRQRILGLPGNPVSAFVCARLFVKPLLDAMLGMPAEKPLLRAILAEALPENDQRQDYLRATLIRAPDGTLTAEPFAVQDSSMQRTLTAADGLIVRSAFAPAAAAGEAVDVLPLDF